MNEFDKFILQQFTIYCEKNHVNIHKAVEFRKAGASFVHQIENRVIDYIEWSIEDDNRNKVRSAVSAGYSKMYPYNFIRYRKG